MFPLFFTFALALAPKPAANTVCPVLGGAVDASSPKVVVNGREYRVCCRGCDDKLKAAPATYLDKDGTPKNAKK